MAICKSILATTGIGTRDQWSAGKKSAIALPRLPPYFNTHLGNCVAPSVTTTTQTLPTFIVIHITFGACSHIFFIPTKTQTTLAHELTPFAISVAYRDPKQLTIPNQT